MNHHVDRELMKDYLIYLLIYQFFYSARSR